MTDIRKLAQTAVDAMVHQKLVDQPFGFCGCGMGALVGYEMARILRRTINKSPKVMFMVSTSIVQTLCQMSKLKQSKFSDVRPVWPRKFEIKSFRTIKSY